MAYIVVYFDGNETTEESEGALASMLYLAKQGHKIEIKWGTPENPVHIDINPITAINPIFKTNDMVVTTTTLTGDNAYMIPGSRESISTPYMVLQNQQGVIDGFHQDFDYKQIYKVNFGAAGIWYVRPELLKSRP